MKPHTYGHGFFGHRRRSRGGSIGGAIVLMVLGGFFLAGTVLPGWSIGRVLSQGWPLLLFVLGVAALVKAVALAPFRGRLEVTAPLLLMTIGVLFVFDGWYGIEFGQTWPVLLLVLGVSILLRKLLSPLALLRRLQ